jgi:hypothetical protein
MDQNDKPAFVRYTLPMDAKTTVSEAFENKVPIYKGCDNKFGCFCTGGCQEIIGYREKHPLEK